MKKHITIEQWKELSKKAGDKYYQYITEKYPFERTGVLIVGKGTGYLLSIGQMIEFLDEHKRISLGEDDYQNFTITIIDYYRQNSIELCDALWEAVKEVLEK